MIRPARSSHDFAPCAEIDNGVDPDGAVIAEQRSTATGNDAVHTVNERLGYRSLSASIVVRGTAR
jgi:hypothetical protein